MASRLSAAPTPEEILERFWGYTSFRPLQADIIGSVLDGHDTLGLLPTGGGKSITFQVPALMLPGLTIVVTPLISLMKDQVDNLRARGVRALHISSALSNAERRLALDRLRTGRWKILYVSPEKLSSASFIDDIRRLEVSLIVVDEAHCISQWGYDFRPSYLHIAELRKLFPNAPVLALTASATPEVADDIRHRLEFRPGDQTFRATFARPNISYLVRLVDHKEDMLMRILRSTTGTAIVYVRSRRRTRELASLISAAGISADYYHAGLDPEDKNARQDAWKRGDTRVIVATNAFGMGIDKPDVRVVVHFDLPSSLEEYYQESGRAGRDGLHSFAVVIATKRDRATLARRLAEAFPDKDVIRRVYELAGNFLSVPVGSGVGRLFEFNFSAFCATYELSPNIAHNALMILSRSGYIDYIDETTSRARVMVVADKHDLYDLNLDPAADAVLQAILRSYPGLFADYVYISESVISRETGLTEKEVYNAFLALGRAGAVSYVPRTTTPYIFFPTSRELPRYIQFPTAVYEDMQARMKTRIDAMTDFVFRQEGCRVAGMLAYFGEAEARDCGACDYCRSLRPRSPRPSPYELVEAVTAALRAGSSTMTADEIATATELDRVDVAATLRILLDRGTVASPSPGIYQIRR